MVGWTLVGEVKLLKRAREGGYLMGVKVRGRGVIGEEVVKILCEWPNILALSFVYYI